MILHTRTRTLAITLGLLAAALCHPAIAQTTTFTYQGRLSDGTNAASGTYDLRFTVFDSSGGPGTVGVPLTNSAVNVGGGVFTVALDFGPGVFTGPDRWLEIAVRTNGSGSFTALSPRQPVNSTPYAIRAAEAGNAAFATSASVASSVNMNAVGTAGLQSGAVTSDKILNGSIAPEDLDATLLTGTFWRLDGNSGTAPGTHFVGTTDLQPLELIVNNDRALRLEPAAEVPNVIGGSRSNVVESGVQGATIAGGGLPLFRQYISADYGAIGGGTFHAVNGAWGTIAGGRDNRVHAEAGTVAGGRGILIDTNANYAAIGGGFLNLVQTNAEYATIPGGRQNQASGLASFAAGSFARANHPGAFVWADSTLATFASTATNQFNIRAAGGVRIQSNPGIQLNAADTPIITRAWDVFSTNAPVNKQGHGRWGLFMEPTRLTIGIPSNDIPNRFFQVAKYDTNGNYVPLMVVDQGGIVSANGYAGLGSGLSGVNADQLDGLDSTDFALASHNHFGQVWFGSTNSAAGLTVQNNETAGFNSAGIEGRQGNGTGFGLGIPVGVLGDAQNGAGVLGMTSDSVGAARGVYGISWATNGPGVGVLGTSSSASGFGLWGSVTSPHGANFGVYGESLSTNGGAGVIGQAHGAIGITYGVRGHVSSASGYAAYFTGTVGSRNYFQRNVGIGTTAPSFLLHLSADSAAKPTSSSWTISSDARLKKNIETLEGSLDKLMQLRGVSYQWIDPSSQGDMAGVYTGLIAQEVEPVFPEWIRTGADGYRTLTVIGFEALAVEALRELRAEKDSEIAGLKQDVAELKALVNRLVQHLESGPQ